MFDNFDEKYESNAPCCLCDAQANRQKTGLDPGEFIICPNCGAYSVASDFKFAVRDLPPKQKAKRYKISSAFRLASEGLADYRQLPVHAAQEVERLISTSDPSVAEKLNRLLLLLAGVGAHPGEDAVIDYRHDYPLICAHNTEEMIFLVNSLVERNLLHANMVLDGSLLTFTLTVDGWAEVSRLQDVGVESKLGFIAMWFDPSQKPVDMAITAAIKGAGYEPIRIDRVEHVNRIDDEIIARIRSSRFLVADFTGQRNGVYFEAGFMLGLGRPVIWLCEKTELPKVHFDTRQYNTIDYSGPGELESRLRYRIEALLGTGPLTQAAAR